MEEVVIVSGVRTPVGKFQGSLSDLSAIQLGAIAVREAVRRINANKSTYMHYFIDYHGKTDPEVAALRVADLRESRLVVCDPAPIPAEEMARTFDWLKSWGMLDATASPQQLVNADIQTHAHIAAE